ncbi:helix-turn-helix domain-containing protein [Pararhodobacter marinus]|uniref:helix-turn-helix domain-containing protein n=1 Tax=Pararhodobacter marinus TaxID=2184063 RepID=UPI0035155F76
MLDLASKLRELRDKNGWTVADMAERTGIPKRTLDKYMLRSGASLPGFDAVCALAKGLGVSLDWLVLGADTAGEGIELIAEKTAYNAVMTLAETIVRHSEGSDGRVVEDGNILGLELEVWAADLSARAGEQARELAVAGTTKEDLLTWRQQRAERIQEMVRDRVSRMTSPSSTQ